MQELVDNLIKAYDDSIRRLEWMGSETRAEALDKLSKFTAKIGYPDVWKDYSKLEIERGDLVGNMDRSALTVYERNIERQGGPVDRTEWSMTPQTVNAYYSPALNEIVFPAAILQPPFFDMTAEDAVNYGGIGAIIGHEIGHGFDDSGSTFDGDGVLRNWWTDEDRKEFEARTAKLVEQYSSFQPFDDLNVNGEFTLGENIGDLGGLSIGLRAYRISLDGKPPPMMDGYTGFQRVFLGYGQAWRYKYRDEALRNQIKTDAQAAKIAKHFPPAAKVKMQELVDNLIKAYDDSIRRLEWMGSETRAEALDKLSKFTAKIGYPDVWKDYSKLEIERGDLVGNMDRSALTVYERNIERQGGPVDRTEWSMTPQTVNAYYSPALNEIVFPAAILQPPFFDMTAEDAVNYGGIGAIIGHEIGHGFDDSGSTFDGDGVLRNWWTDEDRKEFEARTAKLVEQYSSFQPFDDLNVNGEFTLGENIGDLGGLSIGLRAYRISLDGKPPPMMDGYTGFQRVFLGYGQAWRYKYRDEALRNQIKTDPHSPRMYRVNGVVRNVPEFYKEFNIAETDTLYLPPEERVKIW